MIGHKDIKKIIKNNKVESFIEFCPRGYNVYFTYTGIKTYLANSRDPYSIRMFKSIDGAVSVLSTLGFKITIKGVN